MIILEIILGFHLIFWTIMFIILLGHSDTVYNRSSTISSITAVKNGVKDIKKFSTLMLEQELDEIIMIDDYSDDNSFSLLKGKDIISLTPDKDITGKKEAISKAVVAASSNYLLFTDVDCRPKKNWAKAMQERAGKSHILLGYGPMNRLKGYVALFSRYETYHTAIQYFSMAKLGSAYMGVGRNMMVDREKALTTIPRLLSSKTASGDDDLMINLLSDKADISICLDPETYVYSDPKTTIKSFFKQKSRHISSSSEYRLSHQVLLSLYSLTFVSFYTGLIISAITSWIMWKPLLMLLLIKWGIQMFFNYFLMKKLEEGDLLKYFPLLDISMFLYLIILPPYYIIQNKTEWN